jgi:hypothetical protein
MNHEVFERRFKALMKELRRKMLQTSKSNILEYAGISGKLYEVIMSGDFDHSLKYRDIVKINIALSILANGNPKVSDFRRGRRKPTKF